MDRGNLFILIGIIVGTILGAILGGVFPDFGLSVKFIGDLFLHALMMMVVPLVIASMIAGVAALGDVRNLGGIGGRTILYYTVTTALSVTMGLILVNIIQPGTGLDPTERLPEVAWEVEGNELVLKGEGRFEKATVDGRFRIVLSPTGEETKPEDRTYAVLGDEAQPTDDRFEVKGWENGKGNPVSPPRAGTGLRLELAVASKVRGKEETSIWDVLRNVLLGLVPKNLFKAMVETEILPLIVFSLFFGGVLTTMGSAGAAVLDWFVAVNDAILKLIQLIMYSAPFGIFALIAGRIGEAGGWAGFLPELTQLAAYAGTVIGALLIHGLVTLPLILFLFGRRNPFRYILSLFPALLTAFSTASSSGTLPVTMESVEEADVEERTASFVLPLGATINMDGTALYEAVAAMFIAQVYGYDLGIAQQVVIFLTATLAAIGAAGIPEAGLVTMVIVLKAVDLPVEGISLILIIDWFLDRCRTTVNVWGDAIGAATIDHYERRALGSPPSEEEYPEEDEEADGDE